MNIGVTVLFITFFQNSSGFIVYDFMYGKLCVLIFVMYSYCYVMYFYYYFMCSIVSLSILIVMSVPFCVFCVLFVCKCVLYCCHRVSTQLQFNIPYCLRIYWQQCVGVEYSLCQRFSKPAVLYVLLTPCKVPLTFRLLSSKLCSVTFAKVSENRRTQNPHITLGTCSTWKFCSYFVHFSFDFI
jgi:hypothetical protein